VLGDGAPGFVHRRSFDRPRAAVTYPRQTEGEWRWSVGWFRKVLGRGQPDEAQRRVRDEVQSLFDDHGLAAFERQLRFAELVGDRDWVLDQDVGQLRLGDDLAFAAQILGTTSWSEGTWRWSWANPSIVETLTQRARDVEAIGRERGVSMLTSPDLDLDAVGDGHIVALIAAGLLDADGYYRGPHGAGEVYVLVEVPQIRERTDPSVVHGVSVISEALLSLPIALTSAAVATYLRGRGLTVSERGREVRVDGEDGASFAFDRLGRLTEIRGRAETQTHGRHRTVRPADAQRRSTARLARRGNREPAGLAGRTGPRTHRCAAPVSGRSPRVGEGGVSCRRPPMAGDEGPAPSTPR
jgi:hypothetical protein